MIAADIAPPSLDFVFAARIDIGTPQEMGQVALGRRRVIPILGGRFEGPRIAGRIVPGGADWQLIRPDGVAVVEALYTLEASDGTLIYIRNVGMRHGPPEVIARLAAGEAVDPTAYYFRAAPVFEVAQGAHDWLTRSLFVAQGQRLADAVLLRVYAVS